MKLVIASNNPGKLREIREIMAGSGLEILSQREAGCDFEAEETGTTFDENARIKALAAMRATGLPAAADDSGLEVNAMHGAPGVLSSRFCGGRTYEETCRETGAGVPSTTYLAIRQSDNRIVGIIDLRHHINHPILGSWGGHCGYSVRPSERGKGYAKEMLRLNIQNAKALGIEKLLVTCDADNIASEKTILGNGGVFESTIQVEGTEMKRYWITVAK